MNLKLIALLSLVTIGFGASANEIMINTKDTVLSCEGPQKEVEEFLANHEVDEIVNYCQIGKLNCRSLVFFKDKQTGERVRSFEDRFISSEKRSGLTSSSRSVASRNFFIEQNNERFNIYVQESFKNEVEITQAIPQNQNIRVRFVDGYPKFTIHFLILGTNDTLKAKAKFSSHWATISNQPFEEDPAKVFTLKFIQKP